MNGKGMFFLFGLSCLLLLSQQGMMAQQCQANGQCGQGDQCADKYLLDSSAYPSLVMDRYNFIRFNYAVLRFVADCYFAIVNAAFSLYNAFQPVTSVQWQNASQLLFYPAAQAAKMIRDGNISSSQLVRAYIARIKEVNGTLNAMVYYNFEAALQMAQQYDANLASMNSKQRADLANTKPLYGVPFTSKNNLANTGFVITACNQAFIDLNATSTTDATVVARMKAAGAVLLGITGMPSLGLSSYCDDSACGVMNNPHDTRRTTGGSSAGESAIISSAGSLIGLGNDIGGSLRIPTSYCGVFGLKATSYPSHTVPVDGVIPDFTVYRPAGDMLSNGPVCRYASDMPLMMSVLTNKSLATYDISVNFAKKFRLFYQEDLDILPAESLQPEQRQAVRTVKTYFEEKYNLTAPRLQLALMNRELELWALTGYTQGVPPVYPDMVNEFWSLLHTKKGGQLATTWVYSEHQFLRSFLSPKDDVETQFVTDKLNKLRAQLGNLLGTDGVLVMPIVPASVPYHHTEPFKGFNLVYAKLINVLGLPSLVVPLYKSPTTNMPLAVQVVGPPFSEPLLIAVARELEKAFGGWVAPGKLPSAKA